MNRFIVQQCGCLMCLQNAAIIQLNVLAAHGFMLNIPIRFAMPHEIKRLSIGDFHDGAIDDFRSLYPPNSLKNNDALAILWLHHLGSFLERMITNNGPLPKSEMH